MVVGGTEVVCIGGESGDSGDGVQSYVSGDGDGVVLVMRMVMVCVCVWG